jgi:aminopeptidase N
MKRNILIVLFIVSLNVCAQQASIPLSIEPGVSLQLATYRQSVISNIQYTLDLAVPPHKEDAIAASETIEFSLNNISQPLQIDFKQPASRIFFLAVNGVTVPAIITAEHLMIEPKQLRVGKNSITLRFTTGDQSLNRNDEYLYALFVPDRARTVFPCFDQPDLKANFLLTLTVPTGWKVLANSVKTDSAVTASTIIYHFAKSDKLSTYLFSFAAGKFTTTTQMVGTRKAEFLYRETDQTKINLSVGPIFKAHADAIDFLENWTGIPFPFQKIGFVAIPDFQFGGMEHPGAVQYKASSVFLDDGATKDMLISRANLLSHETAHMWFGDMVTMRWFNDVWMKEVFANFMADKITGSMMGRQTFDLKFLQDHYPAAYSIDRTQGANPIRQQLDNLQDAGSMYGNIIYHKAPIMMQQLELLMGKEKFRLGMQEYLKKYAYNNATWNDLITILSTHTNADLYAWNKVWVNEPGRPMVDEQISYTGGKIQQLTLTQRPEFGESRLWPQTFNVTLVYPTRQQHLVVNMNKARIDLKEAKGLAKPSYIIYNSNGIGYGLFPVAKAGVKNWFQIKDPLQRASLYIAAYENTLSARYFKPQELLNSFMAGLAVEKEETNLRLLTGYVNTIYWEFISPASRLAVAPKLEEALWQAMEQASLPNNKKILFGSYQNVFLSNTAAVRLYQIWKDQKPPSGVKLNEDDYTLMALALTLRSDTPSTLLQQQQQRITNNDRKQRLAFLMPALSSSVADRDAFFNSLANINNRRKEAWVTTAMVYLHHPLRQQTSEKYLAKGLEMVEEIQKTGDIFFPQTWLQTILGYYQDKQAAAVVSTFLKERPNYNPKLKDKILQSADNLQRAQTLVQ